MGRRLAADLPVRGRDRSASSHQEMVLPQGLGDETCQEDWNEKVKVAIARKIAVILYCIWVDRTSLEWGTAKAA